MLFFLHFPQAQYPHGFILPHSNGIPIALTTSLVSALHGCHNCWWNNSTVCGLGSVGTMAPATSKSCWKQVQYKHPHGVCILMSKTILSSSWQRVIPSFPPSIVHPLWIIFDKLKRLNAKVSACTTSSRVPSIIWVPSCLQNLLWMHLYLAMHLLVLFPTVIQSPAVSVYLYILLSKYVLCTIAPVSSTQILLCWSLCVSGYLLSASGNWNISI